MPKVSLIIQARMDSTRLPGKSMLDLAGAPLVVRLLERVKRCRNVDNIILAIPDTENNVILEEQAKNMKVDCFRGPENDLVKRYWLAAKEYKSEIIVRLPADNPTPEPSEIDKIIEFHVTENQNGFSSNLAEINNSGYPDGIGAEVFNFDHLNKLNKKQLNSKEKEHIHLNFYDYSLNETKDETFATVKTINCPIEFARPDLILDVNTFDQYIFFRELYNYLYPLNTTFSIMDIIHWYDFIYKQKYV